MLAEAFAEFPVVSDVGERSANERPPRGVPILRPSYMSLWDLFAALQDAADESGATPREADALVVAAYQSSLRSVIPG